MKQLTLIRHAKSSWDNPALDDFHRPLNRRGKSNAPDMGRRLANRAFLPDLMITSPAERASTTARIIAAEIGYPRNRIQSDDRIYMADPANLIKLMRETSEDVDHLVLFGHNPGFTQLANRLGDTQIDNVPTCGVVCLKFEIASWRSFPGDGGTVLDFDFPKRQR